MAFDNNCIAKRSEFWVWVWVSFRLQTTPHHATPHTAQQVVVVGRKIHSMLDIGSSDI